MVYVFKLWGQNYAKMTPYDTGITSYVLNSRHFGSCIRDFSIYNFSKTPQNEKLIQNDQTQWKIVGKV